MSARLHRSPRRTGVALAASIALASGLCLVGTAPASAFPSSWSYDAPGHYTWTVPAGVHAVEVELWGGTGAGVAEGDGGAGAYVDDVLEVSAGQTYDIYVGGGGAPRSMVRGEQPAGGYNGGGASGSVGRNGSGAGGGGATDIRFGGIALTDRVVVAGGGGGSAGGPGGDAGADGEDAAGYSTIAGGGGGGQEAGGAGAEGGGAGTAATGAGDDGALGAGGDGQSDSGCRYTGGGGGGGYYGGGGGGCITNTGGSGGGGGSSLVSEAGTVDLSPNPDEDPDGYALIELLAPDAPAAPDAVAGNGSASVSWAAPWAGSLDITGYTVTASPGGATCSTSTLGCTVPGLTNGTAYTFTVVASSDAGDSDPSEASLPVTPRGGTPPVVSVPSRGAFLSRWLVLRGWGDPAATLSVSTPEVCRAVGGSVVLLRAVGRCWLSVTQGGVRVATASIPVGPTGSGVALVSRPIDFRGGSPYLTPASKARLAAMAPTLRRAGVVVVTGWVSGTRTTPADRALSLVRARVVSSYLGTLGVRVSARYGAGSHWLGSSAASRATQISWYAVPRPV